MDAGVQQLMSIVACDQATATYYLEISGGSVDAAVAEYFEKGGAPPPVVDVPSTVSEFTCESVCEHCNSDSVKVPTSRSKIYKEECTLCFDNWNDEKGITVCLCCFQGGCEEHARLHASLHHHSLAVNIVRTEIKGEEEEEEEEELKELAIAVKEKHYTYAFVLKCFDCHGEGRVLELDVDGSGLVAHCIRELIRLDSAEAKEDMKAWKKDPLQACPHTLDFPDQLVRHIASKDRGHCDDCDISKDLWLCLICGHLGCSRKQYGRKDAGNEHAISHFKETGHPIVVKLGTITPEGTGAVHCYACDSLEDFNYGDVIDPELAAHLHTFNIDIASQKKTEKTVDELELQVNKDFQFNMTGLDGKPLVPLWGPGCTGMLNLGNTCYMASVLQCLLRTPQWVERYLVHGSELVQQCRDSPPESFICQMAKLFHGALSGKYSPEPPCVELKDGKPTVPDYVHGIRPRAFKTFVGGDHPDFSGGQQQDAQDFLLHLLKVMDQQERKLPGKFDPLSPFKHSVCARMECCGCHGVHYKKEEQLQVSLVVPYVPVEEEEEEEKKEGEKKKIVALKGMPVQLMSILDSFNSAEEVELSCPACESTRFMKRVGFSGFPDTLVLHLRRFGHFGGDWVPRKIDVEVELPEVLDLERYSQLGTKPDEVLLPEDAVPSADEPEVNEEMLAMLLSMGYGENACRRALMGTGNASADHAMSWLLDHQSDPDLNAPLGGAPAPAGPAEETVQTLMGFGFARPQVLQGLKETDNNADRAVDWLFNHPDASGIAEEEAPVGGMDVEEEKDPRAPKYRLYATVGHRGQSTTSGHYVSFLHRSCLPAEVSCETEWAIFNDSEVAQHPSPPLGQGYLYFYRKIG